MLKLSVMEYSFLSNLFPSAVSNIISLVQKTVPNTTENLNLKLKPSLNSANHAHKNYM